MKLFPVKLCGKAFVSVLMSLLLGSTLEAASFRLQAEDNDYNTAASSVDDAVVVPLNGEWLAFDDVDLSNATSIVVRAARGDGSAQMTVRLDSPTGTSLGTKTVATGGWRTWQNFSYNVSGVSGLHKVYILAGNPDKPVVGEITVDGDTPFNKLATEFDDLHSALLNRDHYFVSLQGSYLRFDDVNLTGVTSLTARVANGVTGKLTFRIGSQSGTKIAEITTAASGWRNFVDYTSSVTGVTGTHDLYISGSGNHGGVVDYVDFTSSSDESEIVRTSGDRGVADQRHDGGLRPVVGVHEYALFRPTKSTDPAASALEGHGVYGTTFNHHPFLTYWGDRFWAAFIAYDGKSSNAATEATKRFRLQWSDDGRTWNHADAADVFPTPRATHQRSAFFIAANGRLLVTTWYSQNGEAGRGGVGSRLVREIKGPNDFGPIHTFKHNVSGASNAGYPLFTTSSDSAYKAAVQELFDDKLQQQSRWEEDRDTSHAQIYDEGIDPQYDELEAKAFTWYRLADQRIVGQWKGDWFGVTSGSTWSRDQIAMDKLPSRFGNHTFAKAWGEPTTAGRYAMLFSRPTTLPASFHGATRPWYGWDCRTPLAVTTSADGFLYDTDYLAISGDAGPQIYRNASPTDNKAVGPSYVHGLTFVANRETAKNRPNDNVWVTYSTNKEYIWVTEVPKEMSATVADHVDDDLTAMTPGGRVGSWNIRDSAWGSARLVPDPGGAVLRLADKDRYDYAKAVRVFPESSTATVTTRVRPGQNNTGELQIELMSHDGKRPVRLRFDAAGNLQRYGSSSWSTLASYSAGTWYDLVISCDTNTNTWTLSVDGSPLGGGMPFSEAVDSVERVEYRTGAWRMADFSTNMFGSGTPGDRTTSLANADEPVALATFDIASLRTSGTSAVAPLVAIDTVSSGKAYVTGTLANGAPPYIDRGFTVTSLPAALDGAALIRTANDDEFVMDASHLAFTLGAPAQAHVFWSWSPNDGPLVLPAWMDGYDENSALQVTTSDGGRIYRSFSKSLPAGPVVLGGNDRNATKAQAAYFVVVAAAADSGGTTARRADGSIAFGDDHTAYGSVQDGQNGDDTAISVSGDRSSARLQYNAWKVFPLAYTVGADTMLEVTVQGPDVGEIIGIALDNDTEPTEGKRAFLLAGSTVDGSAHTAWGWTLSPRYSAGGSAMTFTIPVGTYFTGSVNYLGLIADDDAGTGTSDITFSNVRIYEVDDNEAPTDVAITNQLIADGQSAGTVVGFLTFTDPNTEDSPAYSLSGEDAASFTIDGNRLKLVGTAAVANQSDYEVTVRVTDEGGLFYETDFAFSVAALASGRDYYVATTGSNSDPGTLAEPFLTMQKAADLARPGDTVLVRGGTYREVVAPANTGLPGAPITFKAYADETVILSGVDPVTSSWSIHSGNIHRTSLGGGLLPRGRNQVLVDGENVDIARYPNSPDIMFPTERTGRVTIVDGDTEARLSDAANLSGAAGRYLGATVNYLLDAGVRTTGLVTADPGTGTLTFDPDMQLPSYGAGNNLKYYLQDSLALLDSPGEWFINRANGELYLWMPDGSAPASGQVEVKRRTYAFDLTDRSHIVIEGFDLYAASISTNTRFDMADPASWTFTSEGVVVDGLRAKYLSYFDVTEQNIPGQDIWIPSVFQHGIFLHGYDHVLKNSHLEQSWGSFVVVLGHDNLITNNWMHDQNFLGFGSQSGILFGRGPASPDGAGIDSARVKYPYTGGGNVVSYNTIHDLGRDAVGYNGNRGGKIVHNHLFNCMTNTDDSGILYGWREDMEGLEIAYNYLHDNGRNRKWDVAIYMDGAFNIVAHHNLIHDAGWGIQTNMKWGGDRWIFNNTVHGDPESLYYFHENAAFDRFDNTYVVNNIFLSAVHGQTHTKYAAQATQYSNNLFASTDAKLVDRANGDYSLAADSPAIDAGTEFDSYTDGFVGAAPDIGAFEYGKTPWLYGSSVAGESGPPTVGPNTAPTDIILSASSVKEGEPVGTVVGNLATLDADSGDTHTYSLVAGDTAAFSILGASLLTAAVFDFATKPSYEITIRGTDSGGLTFEKVLTITVTDVTATLPFTTRLEGENYDAASGNISADASEPHLISLQGKWARYDNIDLAGVTGAVASVANGVTGQIEFRIGSSTGTKIAEISTSGSGSEWRTFKDYPTAVAGSHGVVTLYLVGTGNHGGVLDYVEFSGVRSVTPYEAWSAGIDWGSFPLNKRDPDDDPDGDGYSNFVERALGGNPTAFGDSLAQPFETEAQPDGRVELKMLYLKAAGDLAFQAEFSTDLVNWFTGGVSAEFYDSQSGKHYQTWKAPVGTNGAFGRLQISEP